MDQNIFGPVSHRHLPTWPRPLYNYRRTYVPSDLLTNQFQIQQPLLSPLLPLTSLNCYSVCRNNNDIYYTHRRDDKKSVDTFITEVHKNPW